MKQKTLTVELTPEERDILHSALLNQRIALCFVRCTKSLNIYIKTNFLYAFKRLLTMKCIVTKIERNLYNFFVNAETTSIEDDYQNGIFCY